jgi:hypothetical protein
MKKSLATDGAQMNTDTEEERCWLLAGTEARFSSNQQPPTSNFPSLLYLWLSVPHLWLKPLHWISRRFSNRRHRRDADITVEIA